MSAVRRSTAILTLASFLLTWPASNGCSRLELTHTLKQFDLAIQEVHELRVALQKESGAWQQQLNKMQLKLTSDVRQVINHDVTRLVQEGIIRSGQELRCNVLFLETKVLAYLDGVESALRGLTDVTILKQSSIFVKYLGFDVARDVTPHVAAPGTDGVLLMAMLLSELL